jgi:hypothetical protein
VSPAERCRARFLRFFPGGFRDPTYLDWERNYKADAHERWNGDLDEPVVRQLIKARQYSEIVTRAIRIEARTNLLFSFEKMALRDAVRSTGGARVLAEGLYRFLHGAGSDERRFDAWRETLEALPRRQTRVFTWPVATVFGFIAQPERHMFLKPNVIRTAAATYGVEFRYQPRPQWSVYRELLDLADRVRSDVRDLGPRDLIDIQSFLWVQGSEEYRGRTFRPAQTKRVRFAVA